jgi:hypothetical protein
MIEAKAGAASAPKDERRVVPLARGVDPCYQPIDHTLFEACDRRVPLQVRTGPLQPGCFGQGRQVQGLQHLGQTWGHSVGTHIIELTEGKAQPAVVADRQQRPSLGAVVGALAARLPEQPSPHAMPCHACGGC